MQGVELKAAFNRVRSAKPFLKGRLTRLRDGGGIQAPAGQDCGAGRKQAAQAHMCFPFSASAKVPPLYWRALALSANLQTSLN